MKKKLVTLFTAMLMGLSVCALASCTPSDKDNSSPTPPPSTSTGSSTPEEPEEEVFAELYDISIGFGETYTLEANGENLVWSTSNPDVAIVDNGVVLGVGLGEATISVTNGVDTASCTVVVAPSTSVPSLELDISQRTVGVGKTHTISPVVSIDGVALNVQFTYEMDDPTIATVDANGVITGVKLGTTTLYVSYNAGGYEDGVEITVVVSEDVVFQVSHQYITLCAQEVDGGTYSSTEEIEVTQLTIGGSPVDSSSVTFSMADTSIATVSGGVVTAKKAGTTTLTATYNTGTSNITIDVPVYVVRERLSVEGTGTVDTNWDATAATKVDYAYIELPLSLQIADEEVEYVANKQGIVLTTDQGLTISKSALTEGENGIIIATHTLEYELNVTVQTSFIQVTDYGNQFDKDSVQGIRAVALGEAMDGRNDVLVTKSRTSGEGGIWYNHGGYLRFGNYQTPWKRGVFVFEVKAATGTPLGGYVSSPGSNITFELDTTSMKFNRSYIKVVNSNFTETTFKWNEWNTVVIDYTAISAEEFTCNFMPSFTNTDVTTQYTAYYSNLRYMTKEQYEKLSNPAVEKKYTVKFDMGNEELSEPNQQVSFRGRVEVPEVDDSYQLIGWAIDGQMIDLAKLHVTKDITVMAVYDREYQYTINHYKRQINGAYVLADTEVLEGKMAALVTASPKNYSGYVFNQELSVRYGYVQAFDGLVLACYYESTSYEFENQQIGDGGATITEAAMKDVPYEDLRANTYLYEKTKADGNTMNTFKYTADKVGKYLILNVYYTEISNQMGVAVWGNGTGTPHITDTVYKGAYNAKGKELRSAAEALNNWVSLVIYLDSAYFSTSKDSFYMSLCSWSTNTLYFGEYTYMTQSQVDSFFQASEGPYANGVLAYSAEEIIYNARTGLINIDGAKAYAAGSRVAIRAKNNKGAELKMYASDGSTKVGASEIYTDDGKIAKTFTANTWYTYIFYIDGKITVEGSIGKMFVDTTANDVTVEVSNAYIIDDKFASARFRAKAFEFNGASGVSFWDAYAVSRISSAACGLHTQNDDGTILLESTNQDNTARRYFLDDLETMEKGTYVVWKLRYEDSAPSAIFYQATGSGVDCTTWYDEDKNPIANPTSAQTGKWVYAVWQVAEDIGSSDAPICEEATSTAPGTFTLIKDAANGAKVLIGGAYVMTADGYATFFKLS